MILGSGSRKALSVTKAGSADAQAAVRGGDGEQRQLAQVSVAGTVSALETRAESNGNVLKPPSAAAMESKGNLLKSPLRGR